MSTFSKLFVVIASALLIIGGTSCNTVHGAGQDVRAVGNGVANATR